MSKSLPRLNIKIAGKRARAPELTTGSRWTPRDGTAVADFLVPRDLWDPQKNRGRSELNQGPFDLQSNTLPLSYISGIENEVFNVVAKR